MSKLVLELDYDFDFSLIGIASHIPNYRLAWSLNKHFELDLERKDDIDLSFASGNSGAFSFYQFDDEESHLTFNLISNRSSIGYLIPEMKQIDFFLQYWGPMSDKEIGHFNEELRKINTVLTSVLIDPMDLKSRNNLLF